MLGGGGRTGRGTATTGQSAAVDTAAPLAAVKAARKAGKQPGAPGVGLTQVFTAQEEIPHYPDVCAGCGQVLADPVGAVAYTSFQAVDLRRGAADEPGLRLWVVDYRYYQGPAPAGITPGRRLVGVKSIRCWPGWN